MSISTTSDGWFWKCWRASSPVAASATSQPSSSRASRTAVRMRSSSSTARIRVLMGLNPTRQGRRGRRTAAPVRATSGVRGEQGGPAGAPAGAVVQAVGEVAAHRPAPHEGGGAVLGPGLQGGEVDVDPLAARWRGPPRRRRRGRRRCRRRGGRRARGTTAPGSVRTVTGCAPGGDGRHGPEGWRARSAFRCRSLCDLMTSDVPMPDRRAVRRWPASVPAEQVQQALRDARGGGQHRVGRGPARRSRSVTTAPASVATRPPAARSQGASPRS